MGSKRGDLPQLETEQKKLKKDLPPFQRGPSSSKKLDVTIALPFMTELPMSARELRLNKYAGGKVDHRLLQHIFFDYLVPLLELVKDSFGASAGELNNRLSFVALPILIRILSKKEEGPEPAPVPESESQKIDIALKVIQGLPQTLTGGSETMKACRQKVTELASVLERLLHVSSTEATGMEEDNDEELELCEYRLKPGAETDTWREEAPSTAAASTGADAASTEAAATPKDQSIPPVDPEDESLGESPDSHYDPEFTHELHMGSWSVDLGMKVRDRRFPRLPKMVKDLMDGKSAATIQINEEAAGRVHQLQAYSLHYLEKNQRSGRFSPIYSQLFNVDNYLGAEAVFVTTVKIDDSGKVTDEALRAAQEIQKEAWAQQRPGETFNERALVTMDFFDKRIEEAQRLLQREYGMNEADAKLPAKTYVVADFYQNDSVHEFLTVPLAHIPGPSTWAFLEALLLIGVGERIRKWSWEDVRSRLEADLKKRRSRRETILSRMDKEGWRVDWGKQAEAKKVDELFFGKDVVL